MKRKLEEIIEEIRSLTAEDILDKEDYKILKIIEEEEGTKEKEEYVKNAVEERKNHAITFISEKYKNLDSLSTVTDRDYEIADFKTFETCLGIIKDEEERKKINRELDEKIDKFSKKVNDAFYEV